jgi:hypothetical protein
MAAHVFSSSLPAELSRSWPQSSLQTATAALKQTQLVVEAAFRKTQLEAQLYWDQAARPKASTKVVPYLASMLGNDGQ